MTMTTTKELRDAKVARFENIALRVAREIKQAATTKDAQKVMNDGLRDIDANYDPDNDDLDLNAHVEKAYWAAQSAINAAYDARPKS